MFQPKLFFKAYTHNSSNRERNPRQNGPSSLNIPPFSEGEGVVATYLDQCPDRGSMIISCIPEIIHRIPSVEGAAATYLDFFLVADNFKKINRKNAPNELSLIFNKNTTREVTHGA